ncbi:ribosome biogenesis GTPase Der [Nitratidesulfovibrio vulgaris]|uniref:GTPase Der n=1 Tax=Nitratidesulfovibrio vulgaris (strain ATCC 29579 / DSM 644 / CCUG 34227 / NCIMB 8303 / VKM B-1760 / Hildenborough) TaxID=882 RepID=DER_NITV2|nr:ribosome biogenesis GTPase Der [Nitratidesulfovibrio vulgaris]Q725L9.1 RecName: Full=GTPase Der; AltName: Full=GTP-binding protein EngA [Nitratidesulfovibrio vulgaris str. Hildenborough]AAS97664.1 GTP-binding protein EngA [Nitratidesulfovibrio vulgaris str. Hildenborough]ADP88093.1 ribosome-associated GTPase EngA [Nitratidesulfovibrio vulgaris RCH1]HBW15112.1 ribosome biogenesis GTPase Der [Desulfovibrio sp.]
MFAKIALVGRPNVGKSTLFNRLIRSNRAITHDMPGVTRDRMEGIVRGRNKRPFGIIDTGGITLDGHAAVAEGPAGIRGFEAEILRQAEEAIAECVAVCLVVDGREGLLPFDEHLASYLRRTGKPVLVVVNKVDGIEKEDVLTAEFHILGFPVLAVSAEHGHNLRWLESEMRDLLPEEDEDGIDDDAADATAVAIADADAETEDGASASETEEDITEETVEDEPEAPLRLCMLGRPNAGKSSLVNALTGTNRMIVSDVAGTTRDSVDVAFEKDGLSYTFVDTAGVRRRSRITDTVERYSVNSSLKSTTKAHVTLLVLDAVEGITSQDKRLIELLDERKTPFMVLVNKMDLVPAKAREDGKRNFRDLLNFCQHVPLLFVSAKTGYELRSIVPLAARIRRECSVRIPTGQLNRAMEEVITRHQPPVVRRVRPKFYYMTQAESQPPTFVLFVNDADRIQAPYAKYIEKSLRRLFGIEHAPMRVHFRSSHKKNSEK